MRSHGNRSRFVSLVALLVATLMLLSPVQARAQESTPAAGSSIASAAAWLFTQQATDGGFVGFSGESDPGTTADAIIALAAAKAAGIEVDLTKALDFLAKNALVYAQSGPGSAAKLVLAIVAGGGDPTNIESVNPLSIVETSAKGESGLIGFGLFDHALGVLALVASGSETPSSAIQTFRKTQIDDGSWAFDGTTTAGGGDTNTTAVAVQALVASGRGDDPIVEKAMAYLKSTQTDGGGFPYQPGDSAVADANSTALVVQAIIAVGGDPASADWKNAAGALAAFQNPSGAFRYNDDTPDDNLFATVQALPAITGKAMPIQPVKPVGDGSDVATPESA